MEKSVIFRLYALFNSIKQESSRNAKADIFEAFMALEIDKGTWAGDLQWLYMMFCGESTFGVSKLPDYETIPFTDGVFKDEEMWNLLRKLEERRLTGDNAKNAIIELLTGSDCRSYDVLHWIVNKDPKAGFSIKSINKQLAEPIPTFENHKAEKVFDIGEDGKTVILWDKLPDLPNYLVTVKYDGRRTYIVIPKEGAEFAYALSSKGFEVPAVKNLCVKIAEHLDRPGIVLDGEFFYKDLNETQSIMSKDEDQGTETGLKFYCIGALSMSEWKTSARTSLKVQLGTMRNRAKKLIGDSTKYLTMTSGRMVAGKDKTKIQHLMDLAVRKGFEGLVILNPEEVYSRFKENRKGMWKAKYVDEYDATIVDFEEGTGKLKGRLGAFIVEFNGVRSNVGGSLKINKVSTLGEAERLQFWTQKTELVDKVIRVRSYGITADGCFRHAGFVGFHEGK